MRVIGGAPLSRLWIQSRRAALLLIAPARAWRALGDPAFCHAYPAYARPLRVAVSVTAGAVLTATVLSPPAGVLLALGLMASAGALRWRARATHGVRRGLPPGALDFLATGPFIDPRFYLTAARTHGPVFKCSALARSQVCVGTLAGGADILRIFTAHLRPLSLPFHRFVPGGFLRQMEEPAHETYRRLFSAALSRSLVDHWRPRLEASASRGLERLAEASTGAGAPGVAPKAHVEQLVRRAWLDVFLGVEAGSDDSDRLEELFAVIDIRNLRRASPAAVLAALAGIESWMERAAAATGDPDAGREARRTCVLREILHRTPDALNDPTLVRNLIYMLSTSAGDVAGLLMWVLKLLSDHPGWADRLRREVVPMPEARASRNPSLASRIVSETLRLQQSEFVLREIVRPFRHQGFRFPRGWLLRVCVQESHRDPVTFDRPEEFDPDRFLGAVPSREHYAPFGLDRHACVGESLARAMAEEFAGALAGYQWEVTSDGPTELSDWRHWAPNARFRVRFAARTNTSLPV
jgi:cytochrome P450